MFEGAAFGRVRVRIVKVGEAIGHCWCANHRKAVCVRMDRAGKQAKGDQGEAEGCVQ